MRNTMTCMLTLLCAVYVLHASAQSGRILLEEHFVENDRGWNLGETNNVARRIENGRLILECKKYLAGGGGYWIKCPDFKLPASNYSVSFTTRWIKNVKEEEDTYSPYGIILGDYFFLAYGDGNRRLLKYDTATKKHETIVDWGTAVAIHKKGDADNKWEIKYKDGKAAVYCNGELLYKKEIAIPDRTPLKLYLESSEMVAFDDVIVREL